MTRKQSEHSNVNRYENYDLGGNMKGEGMGVWENVQNIGQKLGRPFIKSDSKTRSERG